jgi:hypothetical protein
MSDPTVSVIILSHRSHLVGQAMTSVFQQTVPVHQVLVNYSPSYWGTKANDIAQVATGDYLIPLCDDDELSPTYVEETVRLAQDQDYDIVYTDVAVFGDRLPFPVPIRLPQFDAEVLRMHCTPWWTALVKKEVWDALGGYDPAQDYVDWDLWIRACKLGARAGKIAKPLYRYRDHDGNGVRRMDHADSLVKLRRKHSALYS